MTKLFRNTSYATRVKKARLNLRERSSLATEVIPAYFISLYEVQEKP